MSTHDHSHSSTQGPDAAGTAGLIPLRHTWLLVPHTSLRVAGHSEIPTADGVAYTAWLTLDGRPIGTAENAGRGGETRFVPGDDPEFGPREMRTFAAACRTPAGGHPSEADVLDELITEAELDRAVTTADRDGGGLLRHVDMLRLADEPGGAWYFITGHLIVDHQTVVDLRGTRRQAVIDGLPADDPPNADRWWQQWVSPPLGSGHWVDLTPRPHLTTLRPPSGD